MINLKEKVYHVRESVGSVKVGIVRSGDLSQAMSVLCYTRSGSAMGSEFDGISSGSDYVSRPPAGTSWVFFKRDEFQKDCEVKIMDDSLQEDEESFSVVLEIKGSTDPVTHVAEIVILGPNDQPEFSFEREAVVVPEKTRMLRLVVERSGTDLSHESSVWCSTSLDDNTNAMPGADFIPVSKQLQFPPGTATTVSNIDKCIILFRSVVRIDRSFYNFSNLKMLFVYTSTDIYFLVFRLAI